MAVIPRLPALYDEPFADSSQIPTFLVSQTGARSTSRSPSPATRGDELFGGYNRYLFTDQLWRRLCAVPAPLRRAAARALDQLASGHPGPAGCERRVRCCPAFPSRARGDKLHKGAGVMASRVLGCPVPGPGLALAGPRAVVLGGSDSTADARRTPTPPGPASMTSSA